MCSPETAAASALAGRITDSAPSRCATRGARHALRERLERGEDAFTVRNITRDATFQVRHDLSDRQVGVLLAGGLINEFRAP